MHFSNLPNELVLHIFHSLTSIPDVLALASTSCHFHHLYQHTSQKLPILYAAAESSFGPLHDAIQILTHNASQPAHLVHSPPLSLPLLKQLLAIGTVAAKWEALYPLRKWHADFTARRLLTNTELHRFRRALYRLWLYTKAFHNPRYARTTRTIRSVVLERAELLHNWSTAELAEIEDVRQVLRDVLVSSVCPSNGTVARKFRKRNPEADVGQLLFNIRVDYPPAPTAFQAHFHTTHQMSATGSRFAIGGGLAGEKYLQTAWHEVGAEGWGDEVGHYYVVEDMLKLDPGQVVWLKENAMGKGMVEGYVRGLGEWFENNGETFGESLEWVVGERGEDVGELREGVREGLFGVVVDG